MAETIVLDPTAVASGRTQIDITSFVDMDGPNWGDAAVQAYMADQTVGSSPVDYRLPNRVVAIPLNLRAVGATSFDTIRTQLQGKAALWQREGGWIMRQVGATALYADVVNATLHLGGDWLQAYRSADVNAVLTLECVPDFYGDEVTLDTITGTGHVLSNLKLSGVNATIAGNHPGRVRIAATDTATQDRKSFFWSLEYQDQPLVLEAESLTGLNGAASAVLTGASGGSAMALSAGTPVNTWVPMVSLGSLLHRGNHRVWARVHLSATDVAYFRLAWGVGSLAKPSTNDAATVSGTAGFYMVDLGVVQLGHVPVGTHQWLGTIQAMWGSSSQNVAIDTIFIQPLDQYAGTAVYVPATAASALSTSNPNNIGSGLGATVADDATVGTVAWTSTTTGPKVTLAIGQQSHYLKVTNLGFAIPTGATIQGVVANIYISPFAGVSDAAVRLVKAGVIASTGDRSIPGTWTSNIVAHGGSTDLWAQTLAPADINSSGFGVAYSIAAPSSGSGSQTSNSLVLTLTVYYVLATGFTIAEDRVIYSGQTTEVRSDGVFRAQAGNYAPAAALGDLPRVPPSGVENRAVELLMRPSRGDLANQQDSGLDALSVVVKYRPSYLFTP